MRRIPVTPDAYTAVAAVRSDIQVRRAAATRTVAGVPAVLGTIAVTSQVRGAAPAVSPKSGGGEDTIDRHGAIELLAAMLGT